MITQQESFNSSVIQEMAELVEHYLFWDRFTLSFGCAEGDIISFAEDILNDKLFADIKRFVDSDPAATSSPNPYQYVFKSYKGMRAILYYRIANHLIYHLDALLQSEVDTYRDPFDEESSRFNDAKDYFYLLARKISEDAAVETGIEINPSARIEKGLVIDHGVHTNIAKDDFGIVIGETCEIGKNCTILNGVTIGASDVNKGAKQGRRHPKIGSNVTICANARILGAIEIGSNVMISPFAVVAHDIPSNCKVSIINQLQIEKGSKSDSGILLYGLIPFEGKLLISGENLLNCKVFLCDSETLANEINVNILRVTMNTIEFALDKELELPASISVCLQRDNTRIYILQPAAISAIIRNGDEKNG